MDIFVSVGSGLSVEQEVFVQAVESRLREEGCIPHTLDRNDWSAAAPLNAVDGLMDRCRGALIIGLERYSFDAGVERRGSPKQTTLGATSLTTSWNQVEAALAFSKGLPLLVLLDERVKPDGLLEPGHDWYIARVPLKPESLQTPKINGLVRSWKARVTAAGEAKAAVPSPPVDPANTSIKDLIGALPIKEVWAFVGVLCALLASAFVIGLKLGPLLEKPEVASQAQVRSGAPQGTSPGPGADGKVQERTAGGS